MQRLAPSLMPATRYVSKQLALIGRYFSIGETPIPGNTCLIHQRIPGGGREEKAPGVGARNDRTRISRSHPAHQEIPVLEIKTAKPTLAHKQYTMPGPAIAFIFIVFVTSLPCTGSFARFGSETLSHPSV